MFNSLKDLAKEHGIGIAVGAGAVGLIWAVCNYVRGKSAEKKVLEIIEKSKPNEEVKTSKVEKPTEDKVN